MDLKDYKEIKSFNNRLAALKNDRSGYMSYWGELSEYHLAQRGRFLSTANNKTIKRNTKQYNNKSRISSRTLSSGMMTGITSPARPWFKLTTSDPKLADYRSVKEWLHAVETKMYRVFAASNFYNQVHTLFTELGVFGTGAMGIYTDYENVIRCKTYTIGSYMLGVGGTDIVDTMYLEYERSVGQLVKEFGIDNVSDATKRMWDSGQTEHMVPIIHAIEPNDDRDHMSPFAKDKPWRSVYFEAACGSKGENRYLRRSGFNSFPIMAPRWDVIIGETYGNDCPGMTSLGDNKALQLGEKRKYQAVDKLSNPPLQGSAQVAAKAGNRTPDPGEVITLGANDKGLESIYKGFNPDLNAILLINQEAEQRISKAFYEDLFLMLANDTRNSRATATEIAERHEEKLLALGPVLERLHNELLNPIIDRVFDVMVDAGIIPPAPKEMQGKELSVEYISVLAQAQRMVAVSGIERTTNYVAGLSQIWPEAKHKFNVMQNIDDYAHAMGVSPKATRTTEEVEEIMAAEAEQMAQQQQMADAANAASIVKTASEADTGSNNALSMTLKNAGLA